MITSQLLPFLSLGPTRLIVKKNSREFLSLSREAHSIFVPFFCSQLEVNLPRFIRSSIVFAPLVACRSRPRGTYC